MAPLHVTRHFGAVLVFAATVMSQTNSSADSSSGSTRGSICNSSISNANVSGIFTFPVHYPLENPDRRNSTSPGDIPDPSWAITVTGGSGKEIKRSLWYDTAGQDYADDLAINYDVCAFTMSRLPTNTLRLGQHDSGNCSSMFTERCINNLTYVASTSAHKWISYSSPPPYENLTAGVLQSICNYIYQDLQEGMRTMCGPELAINESDSFQGAVTNVAALTGYNDSTLYNSDCTLSADNKTFRPVSIGNPANTDWRSGTDAGYDNATQEITPILTVYMPVANTERTSVYSIAPSVLQCVRASNISEGSRAAVALPEGTSWPEPSGGGLSAGAKGGIVVGVVVFALIVGGLVLCLWLVKRKKRARAAAAQSDATPINDDDKNLPPEADGAYGVHELNPHDRKPEIDGVTVSELSGGGGKPSELANTSAPAELPAEDAGSRR